MVQQLRRLGGALPAAIEYPAGAGEPPPIALNKKLLATKPNILPPPGGQHPGLIGGSIASLPMSPDSYNHTGYCNSTGMPDQPWLSCNNSLFNLAT